MPSCNKTVTERCVVVLVTPALNLGGPCNKVFALELSALTFSSTSIYTIPNSLFRIIQQFDDIKTPAVEKLLLYKPMNSMELSLFSR
jgi:hypothetical protein